MTKEERIEKAVSLFKEGYNCSQSVVAAFADMYGFTEEQALKMASAFGGGIGRMRETCGAACGLFMLAGLEKGATKGSDRESKAATYALVQELAAKFKEETGSLRCYDLLYLLLKLVPAHIMQSVHVQRWLKLRRVYGLIIFIEKNSALQSYRHDFRFMFSVISL